MTHSSNRNPKGTYVTAEQAANETNLGLTAVKRLAEKAGAVRRIGKSYRIQREKLLCYIDENCK